MTTRSVNLRERERSQSFSLVFQRVSGFRDLMTRLWRHTSCSYLHDQLQMRARLSVFLSKSFPTKTAN